MTPTQDEQVVVFRVGSECYALPTRTAREVLEFEHQRSLPGAPASVTGVVNLRGEIIPVLRLDSVLGTAGGTAGSSATTPHAIVCDSTRGVIALLADDVSSVTRLAHRERIAKGSLRHPAAEFIVMIDDDVLVSVLDIDRIVAAADKAATGATLHYHEEAS